MLRKLKKCLGALFCATLIALIGISCFLLWAYQVIEEGELLLPNAPGTATISREKDTGVAHIKADNWLSVVYAQGFS